MTLPVVALPFDTLPFDTLAQGDPVVLELYATSETSSLKETSPWGWESLPEGPLRGEFK